MSRKAKKVVLRWTDASDRIAARRGWGIYCEGGKIEIECAAETTQFETDDEAFASVVAGAAGGDPTSVRALLFLGARDPQHLAAEFSNAVRLGHVVAKNRHGTAEKPESVVAYRDVVLTPGAKFLVQQQAEDLRQFYKRVLDALRMPKYTSPQERRGVIEHLSKLAGEETNSG